MKLTWKTNLTIKRMLWGLVSVSIFVVAALSFRALESNRQLIESQNRLTDVALPLDKANQRVRADVRRLTERMFKINEARAIDALSEVETAAELKQRFTTDIRDLKTLTSRLKDDYSTKLVEQLDRYYNDTLAIDTAVVESAKTEIALSRTIQKQIDRLDQIGTRLHASTQKIYDTIGRAVAYLLRSGVDVTGDGTRLDDLLRAQKTAGNLRLEAAFTTNYGRGLLLAETIEQLTIIKDSQLTPAFESALESLKKIESMEIEDIAEQIKQLQNDFSQLQTLLIEGENALTALRTRRLSEVANRHSLSNSLIVRTEALTKILKKLQTAANRIRTNAEKSAKLVSGTTKRIILVTAVVSAAIIALLGWVITRRILIPINKAIRFADTIAKGDLTAEIEKDNDDEVGTLVTRLSEMARSLNALIGQVQRSGIQVTSSATELSATSKQQEAVMRTQVESTNNVVGSVGEITNISAELLETVKKVAAMSEQTADFASRGQTDLSQMEEAMRHMENASKSISGKLEAINEKAGNITSVVTTITKVADQTNLLSLNAAIEAEKAGEYGRGFTVVAREIRRLADQTAVATLDIEQMVQEMQSAVSAGVMEMDAFIAEVQKSAENVGRISMQLTRIIEQVQNLSPSFEGVNESMQYQSENAQKINTAMVNLSEEMQQTVESLRESFMAIEQLNDAARGLQDEVSRFKVI